MPSHLTLPQNFSTSHSLELEWDGIDLLTELKKQCTCTHLLKKEGAIIPLLMRKVVIVFNIVPLDLWP